METIIIKEDIALFYIQALNFPNDISSTFEKMYSLFEVTHERKVFGISRPENGKIVYKVAAEQISKNELAKHLLQQFIIPKGKYLSIEIKNYKNQIGLIGDAFNKLIVNPKIEPNGYCIEWYQTDNDVICMVKLVD